MDAAARDSLTRIVASQSLDRRNLSANNVELRPTAYALHSLYHPLIRGHQNGREPLTVHNKHWEEEKVNSLRGEQKTERTLGANGSITNGSVAHASATTSFNTTALR